MKPFQETVAHLSREEQIQAAREHYSRFGVVPAPFSEADLGLAQTCRIMDPGAIANLERSWGTCKGCGQSRPDEI